MLSSPARLQSPGSVPSMSPTVSSTARRKGATDPEEDGTAAGKTKLDVVSSGSFATTDVILASCSIPELGVVWTAEGGWLRVRHIDTGEIVNQHHFVTTRFITSICAMTVGPTTKVWVGHQDASISVFDTTRMVPLAELRLHEAPVNGFAVLPQKQICLSISKDGRLCGWDFNTLRCLSCLPVGKALYSVAVQPPGINNQDSLAWVGCEDGVVRACTVEGQLLSTRLTAHTGPVLALCLDKETGILWSGGADSVVCAWDVGSTSSAAPLVATLKEHQAPVVTLMRNPGEARMWSLDREGRCVLYHPSRCTAEQQIPSHTGGGIPGRSSSIDSSLFASLVGVREMHIWRIWACGLDGTVRLFSAPSSPADASVGSEADVHLKDVLEGEITGLQERLAVETAARKRAESELSQLAPTTASSDTVAIERRNAVIVDLEHSNAALRSDLEISNAEVRRLQDAKDAATLEHDRFRLQRDRVISDLENGLSLKDSALSDCQRQIDKLKAQLSAERTRSPRDISPPRLPLTVRMDLEAFDELESQGRMALLSLENWTRSMLSTLATMFFRHQTDAEGKIRQWKRELSLVEVTRKQEETAFEEREQTLEAQLKSLRSLIPESQTAERKAQQEFESKKIQFDQLQRQYDSLLAKARQAESRDEDSSARNQTLQQRVQEQSVELNRIREELSSQVQTNNSLVKQHKNEAETLRKRLADFEAELTAVGENYANTEGKLSRADTKMQRLETEIRDRDNEIRSLTNLLNQPKDEGQLRAIGDQLTRKNNDLASLQKETERLHRVISQHEASLENERQRVFDLEKSCRQATDRAEKHAAAEESARKQAVLSEENLRSQLTLLQSQLDHTRRELKTAEEARLAAESATTRNLLQAKKAGEEKSIQIERGESRVTALHTEIEELKATLAAVNTGKATYNASVNAEKDNLLGQLKETKAHLHRVEEERDRLRDSLEVVHESVNKVQSLKQEVKAAQASRADCEVALNAVELRARSAEQERDQYLQEASRAKSELQTASRIADQLRRDIKDREGEIQGSAAVQVMKEREFKEKQTELEYQNSNLRAELTKRTVEVEELKDQKVLIESDARRQMAVVQNEMSQMDAEVASLQRQVHEGAQQADRVIMQGEIADLRQSMATLQSDLAAKRAEMRDHQVKMHQHEADFIAKLKTEQTSALALRSEIGQLQQAVRVKEDDRAALERRITEMQVKHENAILDLRNRLENELAAVKSENEMLMRENKRLAVDNTGMAREQEALHYEAKLIMRNEKGERDRRIEDLAQENSSLHKDLQSKATELANFIKNAEEKEIEVTNKHRHEFTLLHTQLEELRNTLDTQKSMNMSQSTESHRLRAHLEERAQNAESVLLTEKHNGEKRGQELAHEIQLLQKQLQAKQEEVETLKKSRDDIESSLVSRFRAERSNLASQNEALRDQVNNLQRELKNRLDEVLRLQKQLAEKEVILTTQWKEERNELESRLGRFEHESTRLRESSSAKEIELRDFAVSSEKLRGQLSRVMAEKALTQTDVEDLREENSHLAQQNKSMHLELESLSKENETERNINSSLHVKMRETEESQVLNVSKIEASWRQTHSQMEFSVQESRAEARKLKQNALVMETLVGELRQQSKELAFEKERLGKEAAHKREEYEHCHERLTATLHECHNLREIVTQRDSALSKAVSFEEEADALHKKLRDTELAYQGEELERRGELDRLRQLQQQASAERNQLSLDLAEAEEELARLRGGAGRLGPLETQVQELSAALDQARRKILGLEENLHQQTQATTSALGRRDIGYIERQITLSAQLLRRAQEDPENIVRAQNAIADVLTYLRNTKAQEQGKGARSQRVPWGVGP